MAGKRAVVQCSRLLPVVSGSPLQQSPSEATLTSAPCSTKQHLLTQVTTTSWITWPSLPPPSHPGWMPPGIWRCQLAVRSLLKHAQMLCRAAQALMPHPISSEQTLFTGPLEPSRLRRAAQTDLAQIQACVQLLIEAVVAAVHANHLHSVLPSCASVCQALPTAPRCVLARPHRQAATQSKAAAVQRDRTTALQWRCSLLVTLAAQVRS